ncbi:MAG: hypothetical protein HQK84_08290 [Nitrospinae bacterium]|nr:hypothetical protein [Nitrospinota bacterium]
MTLNNAFSEEFEFICSDCGKRYSESEAAQVGSFCNSDLCADSMTLLQRVRITPPQEEEIFEEEAESEKEIAVAAAVVEEAKNVAETVEVVAEEKTDNEEEKAQKEENKDEGLGEKEKEVDEAITSAVEEEVEEDKNESLEETIQEDREEIKDEVIEEVKEEVKTPTIKAPKISPVKKERIEVGLGILVCDTSGSMEDYAIEGQRIPKLTLVAGSVARGIWDLVEYMSEFGKERAYIALCGFNKKADVFKDPQGNSFIKSVMEIEKEFSSARNLAEYISNAMKAHQEYVPGNLIKETLLGKQNTKNFTNVTDGLRLAHELKESCLKGDMTPFGGPSNIRAVEDVCLTPEGDSVNVPNIRCLIYSDGSHNYPNKTTITNPFANDETSVLMSAFFGKEDSRGFKQMESIACICPKHGEPGTFLVNNAERYHQLRGLFRMSSGASGFCKYCLPRDV